MSLTSALQHHTDDLVFRHLEAVRSDAALKLTDCLRYIPNNCEFMATAKHLGLPIITQNQAILEVYMDIAKTFL